MLLDALLLNSKVFGVVFGEVYKTLETEVATASEVGPWVQALESDIRPLFRFEV